MSALVNFPWYDLPELQQMHDRLWLELRSRLAAKNISQLPEKRHSQIDHDLMLLSDQLLITQTCGYDVATQVPRELKLIAAPVFDLPECPRGHYYSYILSTKEQLQGKISLSINDSRSWSGCHALLRYCKSHDLEIDWTTSLFSGSHRKSLEKLLKGEAQLAAIDAVTLKLYSTHAPKLFDHLFVIGRTNPVPAPPYVTSSKTTDEMKDILFEEFRELIKSAPWFQRDLLLLDLEKTSSEKYNLCHQSLFSEFTKEALVQNIEIPSLSDFQKNWERL